MGLSSVTGGSTEAEAGDGRPNSISLGRPAHTPIRDRWLTVFVVVSLVLYVVVRILRATYIGGGFDSTLLGHVLWRLANGYNTQTALTGGYYVSTHASPSLLPFLPVFRWLPEMGMASVYLVQAVSITLIGVATMRLGRYLNLTQSAVRWLVVASLMSPGAWLATQHEVNETTFGIGPLAMLIVSGLEGKPRMAYFWAILAASCRFELGVAVLIAGLILWWLQRRSGKIVSLIAAAFVGGYVLWIFANPYATESIAAHFAHLGSGPIDVLSTAVGNPLRVAEPLFTPEIFSATVFWLLPFAIVPLLVRPVWLLIALPTAGVAVFGVWPPADNLVAHYWYSFLSAGAIAAPFALSASHWFRSRFRLLSVLSFVVGWLILSPLLPFFLSPRLSLDDRVFARRVAAYEAAYTSVPASLSEWFVDRPGLAMFPRPFVCLESGIGPYTAPSIPPDLIVLPKDLGDDVIGLDRLLAHYRRVEESPGYSAWLVSDGQAAIRAYEPCSDRTFDLILD